MRFFLRSAKNISLLSSRLLSERAIKSDSAARSRALERVNSAQHDGGVFWSTQQNQAAVTKLARSSVCLDVCASMLVQDDAKPPIRQSVYQPGALMNPVGIVSLPDDVNLLGCFPRDVCSGGYFRQTDHTVQEIRAQKDNLINGLKSLRTDAYPKTSMYLSLPRINECFLQVKWSSVTCFGVYTPAVSYAEVMHEIKHSAGILGERLNKENCFDIIPMLTSTIKLLNAQLIALHYKNSVLPTLFFNGERFSDPGAVAPKDAIVLVNIYNALIKHPEFLSVIGERRDEYRVKQAMGLSNAGAELAGFAQPLPVRLYKQFFRNEPEPIQVGDSWQATVKSLNS